MAQAQAQAQARAANADGTWIGVFDRQRERLAVSGQCEREHSWARSPLRRQSEFLLLLTVTLHMTSGDANGHSSVSPAAEANKPLAVTPPLKNAPRKVHEQAQRLRLARARAKPRSEASAKCQPTDSVSL